ncbi:putative transcriptional regulator, TetR family protein [Dictyobacter alpinus]|uniref:Putative transcriptional regulator, TetR family protein n=1 Tax=Dictyobacter alpinus TaxID=2014873 RepID=A0A402BJR0_9CHLR|nr:TetR/AcrR family transcriptional regulator [Dictyobacter alpinus]GCE31587.1 putative transcriptional regulator, TetR family protein [Dictyobacter alpinus]
MEGSAQSEDKRVERSKAKVLAETYRQLALNGISGVTIEGISRHSGIPKTTIYRHWPSRSALLIDACSRFGSVPEVPDVGSLQGDMRALLIDLAERLQTANWNSVYPSIIDAAERDSVIASMQTAMQKSFMTPFEIVIERARARGEISSRQSTDDLVAILVGPLFYQRWFSKQKIDSSFIDTIIDLVIRSTSDVG